MRLGDEFPVNAYTTGTQQHAKVAMDAAGGFVVVWEGVQDGDDYGIQGQRFGSDGGALGDPFQVNTYTTSYQRRSSVAMDPAGNFVVVWESSGQDGSFGGVFGQRFAADGSVFGDEFQVNVYTGGGPTRSQSQADVAVADDGSFVVVWSGPGQYGQYGQVIHGRRFSSEGGALGDEFEVSTEAFLSNITPDIAMNPAGEFVVAWYSFYVYFYGNSVLGQRFDADGARIGGEFAIQSYVQGDLQGAPSVEMADDGSFMVVWRDYASSYSGFDVSGRQYASGGLPLGEKFQVNTETYLDQAMPTIATDGGDHFVVAWDSRYQAFYGTGIFGQRFNKGLIFSDGFESGDTSAWD